MKVIKLVEPKPGCPICKGNGQIYRVEGGSEWDPCGCMMDHEDVYTFLEFGAAIGKITNGAPGRDIGTLAAVLSVAASKINLLAVKTSLEVPVEKCEVRAQLFAAMASLELIAKAFHEDLAELARTATRELESNEGSCLIPESLSAAARRWL